MSNTNIGLDAIVEGPGEVRYSQQNGFTSVRKFKGTEAQVKAKEIELRLLGYDTNTKGGGTWELEASIAADLNSGGGTNAEQPVDTWEILPNVVEKDILNCRLPVNELLSERDKHWFRDVLDGHIKMEDWDYSTEFKTPAFDNGDPYLCHQLFKSIAAGVKSKRIYQCVLRHTKTVSTNWQIPQSLTGVGEVWSSGTLAAVEMVPPVIAAQMQISSYAIRNDGIQIYSGWLKGFPTINIAAGSKWQLVQEWEFGEWATVLYTIRG